MLIHKHHFFKIYFGDAKDKIYKKDYLDLPADKIIFELPQFAALKKVMQLENLVFLHQVHGSNGLVIDSLEQAKKIKCFTQEGDFLVANVKHVGIGVMTADCLPIVFFDKRNQVVAIAHAGWKSSVKQIVPKAIDQMQKTFCTKVEDLKVIFGPSAKSCCYKVSEDFIEHFEEFEFLDRVVQRRSDGIYFDLPMYNVLLLEELGVKKDAIQLKYNDCTVCNPLFFSHRRAGELSGRQMTVVSLI